MRHAKCLITGCELFDEPAARLVHGDLHEVDGAYIFNACRNADGETAWQEGVHALPEGAKALVLHSEEVPVFERRGILIIPQLNVDVTLSEAAFKYTRKWS